MANDLNLQVRLGLIDKVLAPLKRIDKAGGDAARALKATRDRLKELDQQQQAVGEFRKLQQGARANAEQLKAMRDRLAELRAATPATAADTKAMTKEIQAGERAVSRLVTAQKRQLDQLSPLRERMQRLGIRNVANDEQRLKGEIDSNTASITRQTAALRSQGEQMRRSARLRAEHSQAIVRAGVIAGAGYAAYAGGRAGVRGVMQPVGKFVEHEDAMLGIARQVNGARDAGGQLTEVYRAVEQQVRDLSREVPLATTQIAKMFTAAARMEVPTDELKEFTRTASMMATAFDAVPDEITESMGKVAKNFKMPITQIEGLADSINYLDDNAISKGADIIGFLNRTSGVISTVAMTARDAAALGSTLLTLGEREETAGTAANAMFTKFAAATKGTKKFKAAVAEIGMTTAGIQKGMSIDAMGTLLKVIAAIGKLPKENRMGVMAELVGLEHSDTLAKLADKPEELTRQRDLANGDGAKGSMRKEAAARGATLSAQWLMFNNQVFNLAAAVGETLKPALVDLMNVVTPMLGAVSRWIKDHPTLVGGILRTALALAALVAAVGALLLPIALLGAKFLFMRFIFTRLFGVSVMGALRAFGAVFMTTFRAIFALLLKNPIVMVALGIAGFATSIIQNWDNIVAAFKVGDWLGIGKFILQGIEDGLNAATLGLYGAIKNICGAAIDLFKWIFGIQSPSTVLAEMGGMLMDGLVLGIQNGLGRVKDAIGNAGQAAIAWFKEKLGIVSPAKVVAGLSLAAAAGTAPLAGAGEPIRIDTRPGLSAPAAPGGRAAGGGGHAITIHAAAGQDPKAIAREVSAELDRRNGRKRASRGSALTDLD